MFRNTISFFSFLFLMLLVGTQGYGQTDTGTIAVKKDPRIELLIKKQIEINEFNTRDQRSSSSGFRIQIMSTNNRAKAEDAKTKFYQLFPDLPAYLPYQSPNYRLQAGNFKTRLEAEAYLDDIKRSFPDVYVVPSKIEVNPVVTPVQQ